MPLPIRLVCAYCLTSVESSTGGDALSPSICPSCGSPIEPGGVGTSSGSATWSPPGDDVTLPVAARPRPATVDRFILGDWLGGGGYGDVYRAFDPKLERDVALKVLKGARPDTKAAERFLREARAAARLDHANIVTLHDAGQDGDRLWIAYRLVKGQTLAKLRDIRALDRRAAVAVVRDLAEALDHAHSQGITHRDLKPANVIVDERGRPHLTDFGLARRHDVDSELTGEGTILGTPAYMSPEQAAGRASEADGRSDIYSLGVVLYELLCGRRPADVPSDTPLWRLGRHAAPPTPHALDRAIPPALDRVCMKALAFNPNDRYQDAASFSRDLDDWLRRRPSRRPIGLAVAALACAVVALTIPLVPRVLPVRGPAPSSSYGRGLPAVGPIVGPTPQTHQVLKPPAEAPAPTSPAPAVAVESPSQIQPSTPGPTPGPTKAAVAPAPVARTPAPPPATIAPRTTTSPAAVQPGVREKTRRVVVSMLGGKIHWADCNHLPGPENCIVFPDLNQAQANFPRAGRCAKCFNQ